MEPDLAGIVPALRKWLREIPKAKVIASAKTADEVRIAIEVVGRDDLAMTVEGLEKTIGAFPCAEHGFRFVQFLQARVENRNKGRRAAILEYRFQAAPKVFCGGCDGLAECVFSFGVMPDDKACGNFRSAVRSALKENDRGE